MVVKIAKSSGSAIQSLFLKQIKNHQYAQEQLKANGLPVPEPLPKESSHKYERVTSATQMPKPWTQAPIAGNHSIQPQNIETPGKRLYTFQLELGQAISGNKNQVNTENNKTEISSLEDFVTNVQSYDPNRVFDTIVALSQKLMTKNA